MDILFLLIPLGVVLALAIGAAFWLAVDGGQFDDLEGPGLRVVIDDDDPRSSGNARVPAGERRLAHARKAHESPQG